jgi:flavin-dependent dehydrogenase
MGINLVDGSRVCIIGGGPAGSLSALHLQNFARKRGMQLDITIFEPRDHTARGARGCKGCAGILSTRLLNGLATLDISLPEEVIQSELHAYSIHVDGDTIHIQQPDARRRIASVYRGGGPHTPPNGTPESFDRYLLSQACANGARLVQASVRKVENERLPVVSTARESYPAELVVLATGMSSHNPFTRAFGYRGPLNEIMVQEEVLRPEGWPADEVIVYLKQPVGMVFGVLIPKGKCLNVSLLGRGITQDAIIKFIDSLGVGPGHRSMVGLCGCAPRIAISPAKNFYGDRWVAVGDAAVSRLYKDGIGSAFFTAKNAMQVAISDGITKDAFRKGYGPYCKSIAYDNFYGRILFRLWEITVRSPFLLESWKRALYREIDLPEEQRIHMRILWGMLTGDESYRKLASLFLNQRAMRGLLTGLLQAV